MSKEQELREDLRGTFSDLLATRAQARKFRALVESIAKQEHHYDDCEAAGKWGPCDCAVRRCREARE